MFLHSFGVQDPMKASPPCKLCPNYKCNEFFNSLCYIWKESWDLGPSLSADEQTFSMKGKSQYKTHCSKFKHIGDRIQTNAIADNGYTWDFYSQNKPIYKKWMGKELSLMHAQLLHMFKNFQDLHHSVNVDNLFNLVNFTIVAANCKTKVLT